MGKKDDFVIQIKTTYKDDTSEGLKKTKKNVEDVTESIEEFDKKFKTIGLSNASPVLTLKDKASQQLDETEKQLNNLDDEIIDPTLMANDKASAVIDEVMHLGKSFADSPFSTTLTAADKASQVIEQISSSARSLVDKAWNMTVAVTDKATEPLRKIYNWATSVQGIVTGMLAGAAAQKIVADPIDIADFYTQADIGFATMLKSEEKAKKMMDDINTFAIATPFEARGLTDISQRMLAMGWAAEKIIPDLETIGNTMAAMGKGEEGIQSVTLALSQMRANGKVNGGDMMQLTNQGISAWQYLATAMGKTVGEVRELASAGKIQASEAVDIILNGMKQFDGMMQQTATKTVAGLLSQIEEAATVNLWKPWGEGIQQGILPGMSKINDLLSNTLMGSMNMGEQLRSWGETLGSTVMNGLADTAERFVNLINNPEFKSASLGKKITMLLDEGVVKPVSSWWKTSGRQDVTEIATAAMKTIGSVAKELIPVVIQAAFSNPITATMAMSWGVKTASSMIGGLVSGLSGAKGVLNNTRDILKGISNIKLVGWGGFKGAIQEAGSLSGALKALASSSKGTGSAIAQTASSASSLTKTFKDTYSESGSLVSAFKSVSTGSAGIAGSMKAAGAAGSSFLGSLTAMAPAILGVTAAVAAGVAIYHNYTSAINEARDRQTENIEKTNELVESSQQLITKMHESTESTLSSINATAAQGAMANSIASQLWTLNQAQEQNAGTTASQKALVEQYNAVLGQTVLTYDEATNKLYDQNGALVASEEALRKQGDAIIQNAIAQQAAQGMAEAYKQQAEAIAQLNTLTPKLNAKYAELQAAYESYNATKPGSQQYYEELENVKLVSEQYDNLYNSVNGLKTSYEESGQSIQTYQTMFTQASQGMFDTSQQTFEGIKNEFGTLPTKASEVGDQMGQNYATGVNNQQENAHQAGRNLANQTAGGAGSVDMTAAGSNSGSDWLSGFKSMFSGIGEWWNSILGGLQSNADRTKASITSSGKKLSKGEAPRVQDRYAEGGILDTPHIGLVAEDGPEAIIPLGNKRKSKGVKLWEEAGKRLGLIPYAEGGISGGTSESSSGSSTGASTGSNIATTESNTMNDLNMIHNSYLTDYSAFLSDVTTLGNTSYTDLANSQKTINEGSYNDTLSYLNSLVALNTQDYTQIQNGVISLSTATFAGIQNINAQSLAAYNSYYAQLINITTTNYTTYVNLVTAKMNQGRQVINEILNATLNDVNGLQSSFYQAGADLITSMNEGMQSKKAEIEAGASSLVASLKSKFEEGLGIHSPSRWGEWVGQMIDAGVIKGMDAGKLDQFVSMVLTDMQTSFDAGKFNPYELVDALGAGTLNLIGKLSQVDMSGLKAEQIAYPLIGTLGTQTSWFGHRESPGGIGSTNHQGADLAARTGTGIAAALGGIVTTADWYGGYGNAVVIDSGNGLSIVYGHMSQILAQHGQNVAKGTQIGLVGSTGNSTGPHLHFEMRRNGEAFDPQPYLEGAGLAAGSPLVTAIQNAYNARMGIASATDSVGNVAYDLSAGVEQWRATVLQALAMLGQPASLADGVLYAIQSESGGNPNAINLWDSNAATDPSKGLLQTIGATFNAYRNPSLSSNIYDPLSNIYAGLNYMIQRYGSVANVVNPRLGGWYGYARGTSYAAPGLHWVGEEGPELLEFSGGEKVFPAGKSKQIAEQIETGAKIVNVEPSNVNNTSEPVTIELGEINFNITVNGDSNPDNTVNAIKEQLVNQADELALIIAQKLANVDKGIPQNGALA